jgi:hypothetical protein
MSGKRAIFVICLLALGTGGAGPASTPATTSPTAQKVRLTLNVVTEEQRKQLQVTVISAAAAGKPLENVTVAFAVKRMFGDLVLGVDKTLDDGTAAVLFPNDLPGGPTGQIQVLASVTAPPEYAGARVEVTLPAGRAAPDTSQAFPRALWAPRAPVLLIVIIFLILGAVWFCYAYVAAQLVAILRKR